MKEEVQRGFPARLGLFKVKTFALRPEGWSAGGAGWNVEASGAQIATPDATISG